MTRNQLPEGVGKKIVEALKRQAEADITPLETNNTISNTIPLTDIEDDSDIQFEQVTEKTVVPNDNLIIEEETPIIPDVKFSQPEQIIPKQPSIQEQSLIKEQTVVRPEPVFAEQPVINREVNIQKTVNLQPDYMTQQAVKQNNTQQINASIQIKIPANVAVLKNLISTLPAGVSKQTGAYIIRQTLEAMGLPINSVLKEAQDIQEELNSSTRECMIKIQEYKTNILQLEQSVQEYQQNINQINDLVSLFLLTGKD